jgi:hypothetical protein
VATKTLTFDASPRDTLVYDSDKDLSVHGGEDFVVSEEQALELITNPGTAPYIKEVAHELRKFSREKLNEVAVKIGIDAPEDFPNKDALLAAIENYTPPQPSVPPPTVTDSPAAVSPPDEVGDETADQGDDS